MSKLHRFLSILFLFSFSLLFYFPQTAQAAPSQSCDISYTPNPADQNMDNLTITINPNPSVKNQTYRWLIAAPNNGWTQDDEVNFNAQNGVSIIIKRKQIGWKTGNYELYLAEKKGGEIPKIAFCKSLIPVQATAKQTSCTVTLKGYPYTPDTDILVDITSLATEANYDIFVNDFLKDSFRIDKGEVTQEINLGIYNASDYYEVSITKQCGFIGKDCWGKAPQIQCPLVAFSVGARGTTTGGPVAIGTKPSKKCGDPGVEECSKAGGVKKEGCTTIPDPNNPKKTIPNPNPGIATAIGCIRTNPVELTKDFLKFALGISGGLAFLLMILGAFQMLTSAGNPETLNAGKERLTSAVIGLLLIIFAVLLLQIIGVDILGIPGFKR